MIDLSQARKILNDSWDILDDLDGLPLGDAQAVTSKGLTPEARAERAQASRDLLMLADRLAAAEAVVRQTYWKFKGEDSVFDGVTQAAVL